MVPLCAERVAYDADVRFRLGSSRWRRNSCTSLVRRRGSPRRLRMLACVDAQSPMIRSGPFIVKQSLALCTVILPPSFDILQNCTAITIPNASLNIESFPSRRVQKCEKRQLVEVCGSRERRTSISCVAVRIGRALKLRKTNGTSILRSIWSSEPERRATDQKSTRAVVLLRTVVVRRQKSMETMPFVFTEEDE